MFNLVKSGVEKIYTTLRTGDIVGYCGETMVKGVVGWRKLNTIVCGSLLMCANGTYGMVDTITHTESGSCAMVILEDDRTVICDATQKWYVTTDDDESVLLEKMSLRRIKRLISHKIPVYLGKMIGDEYEVDVLLPIKPKTYGQIVMNSNLKKIDPRYFDGSYNQRMSLLDGILEVGIASVKYTTTVSIVIKNDEIWDDIKMLANSVGMSAVRDDLYGTKIITMDLNPRIKIKDVSFGISCDLYRVKMLNKNDRFIVNEYIVP